MLSDKDVYFQTEKVIMDTRPRKSQRKTSPPAPSVASTIGDLGVAGLTMGQQLVYRPVSFCEH